MAKNTQKPLLIVCGPTATGKTELALKLAKKFSGEIISADSRQVYRGMDIGTGKDLPLLARKQISAFKYQQRPIPYYLINNIKVWGYDLVEPDQDFSLSHFVNVVQIVIDQLWQQSKLPLLVGGTGLYLKGITEPLTTIGYPPNQELRQRLAKQSVKQLQTALRKISPSRFESMNRSDRHNPRRLIRAIEIAVSHQPSPPQFKTQTDVFWLGLTAPLKVLDQRVDKRIDKRIELGVQEEISSLINQGYGWDLPAMSAIGYQQWRTFFSGKLDLAETIQSWRQAEKKYLRRQLTWFKKNPLINWFDIIENNYQQHIAKQVAAWYTKLYDS